MRLGANEKPNTDSSNQLLQSQDVASSKSAAASEASSEAKRARAKLAPTLIPILIFAFAFFLRYLYNAVFMEHRIAHFGDAYNFLRTGTCLLEAAMSSHSPLDFIGKIYHASAPQAQLLQSMTSMKLTDRLLIDGPVYPAYLAIVEWLSGVDPIKPIFDSRTVQMSLCNSFVDALSCVLIYWAGRLAFNRRIAILAAVLFAVYPAAIINTQHCYSEPFSYFLLCIWTALTFYVLLRHNKSVINRNLSWGGIGICSGLMMLSKPAFILLPPMVAAAILPFALYRMLKSTGLKNSKERGTPLFSKITHRYLKQSIFAALGLVMVLTPWVFFNKAASGQYSVFVNRVPSFNIFHGNQINTDGWRCYPFYGCFPGDSKLVMAALMDDARQQPGIFLGLQFKKIARLWSGVWNEYHYSLFGIQLPVQSLFHQLLLLSATFGLSFLLFKTKVKTLSREFSAALVLGTIIVFHFAYIPFEAISRYAITAMPAVILLSAAFYSYAIRQKDTRNRLLLLLGAAAVLFLLVSVSGTTANIVASFLPQPLLHLAPWIAAALACAAFATCFALGANLLQRLNSRKDNKPQFLIPALVTILAGSVAAVYTIQSFDWREWQCAIKPQQSVSQSILIPEKITAPVAFVLIDLSSQAFSPPVKVDVNGQTINEPLVPLAQFQPNNADILQCLAIQGEGMGLDLRTFRNWWVVPVKSELLKKGVNQIELTCADNSTKSTVYGDFAEASTGESDGNVFLPSLRSFSYTKGFTTFDNRDTRVFEKVIIQGKTTESIRKVASTPDTASSPFGASSTAKSTNDTKDLSQAAGIQSGRYRIRILVAQSPQQQNAAAPASVGLSELTRSPINLLGEESSQLVDGQNPTSFAPPIAIVNLPSNLPAGTRFTFSCQLRSVTCKRPYFVSVNFSGQDAAGDQKTWSSKWQPIAISPSRAFRTTSFTDTIPTEILELKNLQVHPMFSPFQPDFLFLKRAQALRSRIEIRSANLSFLPPLDLPPLESRTWQLY